jgi:hypothetical protein
MRTKKNANIHTNNNALQKRKCSVQILMIKCVNPHMTINKVAQISPNNHANTLTCQNVGMFPMKSATIEKSRNVINYPLNNFVNMSTRQSAKEYPLVFQSKNKNSSVLGLNIDNIMMIIIAKQHT